MILNRVALVAIGCFLHQYGPTPSIVFCNDWLLGGKYALERAESGVPKTVSQVVMTTSAASWDAWLS